MYEIMNIVNQLHLVFDSEILFSVRKEDFSQVRFFKTNANNILQQHVEEVCTPSISHYNLATKEISFSLQKFYFASMENSDKQ